MFATLILVVLSAAIAFGADENVAFFDNLDCKFNSDYCGATSCSMTPHNNKQNEQHASLTCELKKTIDDLKVHVTIFAKELNANLVDIDEDFCAFMSGKKEAKLLTVLMPFIKKYSNVDHPCPYSGSVDVKELPLGSHLLASHDIPSGDYNVMFTIMSNGVYVSNATSQLHIPEGKAVTANRK